MRIRMVVFVAAFFAIASCDGVPNDMPDNATTANAASSDEPRVENLPPRDEGYAISLPERLVTSAPAITVDAQYTGQERADLEAYISAAVDALTSATTAGHATALNATYSRVWLNGVTEYEGLASVGALARSPREGFAYLPARLVMQSSGTGAFESKDPNSTAGGRLITIRRYHLDWWRSPNAVTRSCAVNTLAHEITHNMTRDPNTFLWAFTDTGLGGTVTSEKGSYTMGALAQCTYLQSVGRIAASGVAQCVAMWGLTNVFLSSRCDDFDDSEPVKWPKDARRTP